MFSRFGTGRLLFLLVFLPGSCSLAYGHPPWVKNLIRNGGYGFVNGKNISGFRENDLFIPASTLKILTSLVALETLGDNYRFKTYFFLDKNRVLFIKGGGDPFLISEEIKIICTRLVDLGLKKVSALILDDSAFNLARPADGSEGSDNPYDAPNSALAVNFNSLPVFISAAGSVTSGEQQTPDLPIMRNLQGNLPAGFHRINIDAFADKCKISPSLQYAGELFIAQLRKSGVQINNTIHAGKFPDISSDKILYTHFSSRKLTDIVRSCLKFSNNFTANQLFLTSGASVYGYPANWLKASRLVQHYARNSLNLPPGSFNIVEGSGLSRKNRITPAAMLQVLKRFYPYRKLLNENEHIYLKSGTLTDVFCYAGYFKNGWKSNPFVLMLNQTANTRKQVLQHLENSFSSTEKYSY
ncbi:D-alanyl-D-alanine carboxypeptidase/D-alanyl-D-alanine-endopeptidase [Desulfomarina sp.]